MKPLAIALKLFVTFSYEKRHHTKIILLYHFDVYRIKRVPGNTHMFLITYVLTMATFRLNINHVSKNWHDYPVKTVEMSHRLTTNFIAESSV